MPPLSTSADLVPLRPGLGAVCLAAPPREAARELLSRLAGVLEARGETALLVLLFGRGEALGGAADLIDCPILAVEGRPCHAGPLAGVQAFTCPRSETVHRIRQDGRAVATWFDDGGARQALFVGHPGGATNVPRAEQARRTFASVEMALGQAGFGFPDLVRTWFYNHEILAWYGDFNAARNGYYSAQPFRSGALPASTGIDGRYPSGAALGVAGWLIQPKNGDAGACGIPSPLQCPAPNYGSAFSRAIEAPCGGRRRLSISGTASIAQGGESVWPGDVVRQIERTMEVVGALLHSRQLAWADVDRATAYFKRGADLPMFERWLEQHGLAGLPFVPVEADICRAELLFELEVDACR